MILFRLLLVAFYVSFITSLDAKPYSIENARFRILSTENGLSQRTVHKIFQDEAGFIWVATQEGLNRFDGVRFKTFRHLENDEQSLSHDFVRDIAQDSLSRIWVASMGGLDIYHAETESFQSVPVAIKGQKIERFRSLHLDSNNDLWLGSDGDGLFRLSSDTESNISAQQANIQPINRSSITAIFEDSRGRFWVGTDGQGLFQINRKDLSYRQFTHSDADLSSISHNKIRSIFEDSKGHIWVGTRGGGLNRYEQISDTFVHHRFSQQDDRTLSHDRVFQIAENHLGELWIATDKGVSVYVSNEKQFYRIQNQPSYAFSLSDNRVLSVLKDRSGLMWIGTQSGLNIWDPVTSIFVNYRHIPTDSTSISHDIVTGFYQSRNDRIYVSTYGGGLNYFDTANKKFKAIDMDGFGQNNRFDLRVMSLLVDKEKRLWVGTQTAGLYQLNEEHKIKKEFKTSTADESSISANGITDIIQDRDGDIWASTFVAGLNRLDKKSNAFKRYIHDDENKNSLSKNTIYQLMEDDEGYIWIGTDGGGLSRLNKRNDTFTHFKHKKSDPNSLSGDIVMSLLQDSKGRFWIGTQGNGLNRWEPDDRRKGVNRFKHYSIQSGLNSSSINGVLEDDSGNIWISTNRGVTFLNPETEELKNYNIADEIHQNEFVQGALLKSFDGRLYLGGLNGISAFYPKDVQQNAFIPPIVLLKVSNQTAPFLLPQTNNGASQIDLNYKDYLVTFEFAALDFSNPKKNQYQYKLEGLDQDWIHLNTVNRATFTNLPSGQYTLKVKGSNNDGVWSDESINLKIIVHPAPWMSWWAFSLYALIFCLGLILIIRFQAKRLAEQDMFQQKVSEKVGEKIQIYVQNNELLNEQLRLQQQKSGVDLETGIPNASFFIEQLHLCLKWMFLSSQESKLATGLIVGVINLNQRNSNDPGSLLSREWISMFDKESLISDLICRWNQHSISFIKYVKNQNELDDWTSQFKRNSDEKCGSGWSASFIHLTTSVIGNNLSAENIMMLIDHILYESKNNHWLGLTGIAQSRIPLDSFAIQNALSNADLFSMGDLFEFFDNTDAKIK